MHSSLPQGLWWHFWLIFDFPSGAAIKKFSLFIQLGDQLCPEMMCSQRQPVGQLFNDERVKFKDFICAVK